jgi:hypothetical protein
MCQSQLIPKHQQFSAKLLIPKLEMVADAINGITELFQEVVSSV